MPSFTARNKVAIVGYAQSPIVRRADRTLGQITLQTVREAIADAGLTVDQVDGYVTTPLFPSLGSHAVEDGVALVTASWVSQRLGVYPAHLANIQGQLPGAVVSALQAIHSGAADYVVVHRALHNPPGRYHQMDATQARGAAQWENPQGHYGPIAAIAMCYNEYAARYGAPENALASVVIEARKNGARIPWSFWKGKPLSMEDYLAAPMIDDPMRMVDCDIPVDGVAAFVFTSAERAKDGPHKPVYVTGYSEASPIRRRTMSVWPYDDMVELGARNIAQLWDRAGLDMKDIDYPQLYDGFSPIVLFWLEALGICPTGEAHRFVADGGLDSDKPGAIPGLAGGGALGCGRMHGVPQMLECYLQLARRAGERQREATVALACQGPPHMGGAVVYSAEDAR